MTIALRVLPTAALVTVYSWLYWRSRQRRPNPTTLERQPLGLPRNHPPGGSPRLRAYMLTRQPRGTRTPATATSEGCSSLSPPGPESAVAYVPISPHDPSNWFVLTSSGFVTGVRGASGEQPDCAD